jgi:hypothetical protein
MPLISTNQLWTRAIVKSQIAKLDEKFATLQASDTDLTSLSIAKALDVIVELHRPIDNESEQVYPNTYFEKLICAQCVKTIYPCPTIEAIRNELI